MLDLENKMLGVESTLCCSRVNHSLGNSHCLSPTYSVVATQRLLRKLEA